MDDADAPAVPEEAGPVPVALDRSGRPISGRRLRRRLVWQATLVGHGSMVAGVVFVFAYLTFLVPVGTERSSPAEPERSLLEATAAVGLFLALAVPLTHRAMHRAASRRLAWLDADRAPDYRERRATLGLPGRLAAWYLLAWLAGAAFFTAGTALDGGTARQIIRTGVTIALGGLVTAALVYLANERVARPVFARALAGDPLPRSRTRGVRPRLVLFWVIGSGIPLLSLAMLPVVTIGEEGVDLAATVLAVSVGGLVAGGLITLVASKSIADPLRSVRRALVRVRDGDLEVTVPVDAGGELGELQSGVNAMVNGLRERRRLEDLFGRHVGEAVARRALQTGAGLESEQREASALFVDLVGSSALVGTLSPVEVVERLNAMFREVVQIVDVEGGWVNKFEGDGALCLFGVPGHQPDHAARALRAACGLRAALVALTDRYPELDAGIGVSCGPVVAGDVGADQRYEYTVIGAPVHEAARLTELAKGRPGRVLASGTVVAAAGDEASRWRPVGLEQLRGQQAPTDLFEPQREASGST